MKTIFYTILLLVLSACCKNTTEPDPCSTETRMKLYNGTEVSFDKIKIGSNFFDFAFDPDVQTTYFILDSEPSNESRNIYLRLENRYTCYAQIDLNQLYDNKGCYTLYITDVDTLHVFNDTMFWYKIIHD